MARDWSTLPDSALVSILSHVQLHDRLRSCALVHTSWAAAAVVATTEMQLSGRTSPSCITRHLSSSFGSGLHSLQVDSGPKQLLSEFPALPALRELQLVQVQVQLGAGFGRAGIVQSVSSITHLLLQEVVVVAGLHAVAVLTSLRSLSITDCTQPACGALLQDSSSSPSTAHASTDDLQDKTEPLPVPGTLLPQLLRLSHLELRGGLSDDSVRHISRLTQLDSLGVDFEGSQATAAAIGGLGRLQALTFLALTDSDIHLGPGTVPGLSRLLGLESLWLYNCRSIDPVLLSPLTRLQHLDLDGTPPAGGPKGAAALLSLLPKLQRLTHLDLCECLADVPAAPAAAYSALLSSSTQLAYLDIYGAATPPEAWAHLLGLGAAAPRTFPQLQRLHLCGAAAGAAAGVQPSEASSSPEGLTGEQLQQLVRACPGLQHLQCWLAPGHVPASLLGLSGLTALALSGVTEAVCWDVLLQLRGLQELHVLPDSDVDETDLIRLTALTQLSQLGLHHEGCSPEFMAQYESLAVKDGEDLVLLFDVELYRPNHPRDVWLKLLKCCVASPRCRPKLAQSMQGLMMRERETLQHLQQLKGQLFEQQAQLAAWQEQLAARQAQPAARQQVPEGLGGWCVENELKLAEIHEQFRIAKLVMQGVERGREAVSPHVGPVPMLLGMLLMDAPPFFLA